MIKTVVLSSILAAVLGAGAASAQERSFTWGSASFTTQTPAPVQNPAQPHANLMALAGEAAPVAQTSTYQAFGHTFERSNAR